MMDMYCAISIVLQCFLFCFNKTDQTDEVFETKEWNIEIEIDGSSLIVFYVLCEI